MSFYQVSRYVGFSIGSGLAVTLLRAFDGGGVPDAGAYSSTFLVGAGLCLATAALAWWLPGTTLSAPAGGDELSSDERAFEEGELGGAGLERLEAVR